MSDQPDDSGHIQKSPEERAERAHFERLYSKWLHARAVEFDPDQDDDDQTQVTERNRRVDETARLLLSTPAPLPYMVWWKWEVMELWVDGESLDGQWANLRTSFAVGCIKVDLMRFGIADAAR
jgi:hypothetical protein